MKEQVKAVSIEDSPVRVSEGGFQRNPVHNYDVRTQQVKRPHKVASFHPQIRQAKHETTPMPVQELLHRQLHQFKDVCQSFAAFKFHVKIICSLVVQGSQLPKVQYLDLNQFLNFAVNGCFSSSAGEKF